MFLSRKKLLLLGTSALLLGGGYFGYGRVFASKAAEPTATPVEVNRGNLRLMVSATGNLKPQTASDLSFRSSGVVQEIYVKTGDSVKRGQPLAKLETRPLELQVTQAEIDLRSSQISLETLLAAARPEDVATANASLAVGRQKLTLMESQGTANDIAAAEASAMSAEAKFNQLINPSPEDIAAAESAIRTAEATVQNAEASLDQLLHPTVADLAAAESALSTARANRDKLRNPPPQDIAAANATLENAKANLAKLRERPSSNAFQQAQLRVDGAKATLADAQRRVAGYDSQLILASNGNLYKSAWNAWVSARDKLQSDTASNQPQDRMVADRQALEDAGRALDAAGREVPWNTLGFTMGDYNGAQEAVRSANLGLQDAQRALADLDPTPSPEDILAAEASVQSAQAKLNQLLSPTEADLTVAENNIIIAQQKLQDLRQPRSSATASARAAIETARANVQKAQRTLDLLRNPTEVDLAAARASIMQAQNQLTKTRAPYTEVDLSSQRAAVEQALGNLSKLMTPGTALDIARAQLNIDKARLNLDQAKYNLDQAVLTAAFDGIISNVPITAGSSQGVGASTVIVSLIDPSAMQVQANVDETDIAKLKLGLNTIVMVEAAGQRPYRGALVSIAPSATVQSGVTSYQITVNVPETAGLKAGMTAVAQIVYDERQDILLAPNRAIKTAGRERSVQVLVDGRPETRTVQTGIADDQFTEVTDGLQPGDQVMIEGRAPSAAQQRLPTGAIPGGAAGFGGGGFAGGAGGGVPARPAGR